MKHIRIVTITLELHPDSIVYFEALARTASNKFDSVEDLLDYWISTLSDGIRRPGSWERQLLPPAFGDLDGLSSYLKTNDIGQLLPERRT